MINKNKWIKIEISEVLWQWEEANHDQYTNILNIPNLKGTEVAQIKLTSPQSKNI